MIKGETNLIGSPFEILSEKALKHYEKRKEKGENIYIDSLTYDEFMLLGDTELSRRFTRIDEKEQRERLNREQGNELEFTDESEKSDDTTSGGNSIGSRKLVKREKTEWEDTISNRMLHWSYSTDQKEEVRLAMSAGVSKAKILEYFYPDISVEYMRSIREIQAAMH